MPHSIFTVTTVKFDVLSKRKHRGKTEYRLKLQQRTHGFFFKKSEAVKAIQENRGSMVECLYDFLVLEEFKPGIYGESSELQWYREASNVWHPCEKPPELSGIVGWGVR